MYNIAVIGAGVIGLSTALNIQKTITNVKVRIIADKFVTETTSYGAAGIFLPLYSSFPDTPREKLRSWYTDSWKFYSSLALSSEADGSGFMVCPGYVPCNTRNEEFVGKYDVIVNCSGFGSRELFNDKSLYSIRGQIAK
ncbi:hypothetical protein KUTeg_019866, partial [Tegillarca granosa]